MTTATGEYTSSLPPRLSALSISGHPDGDAAADHTISSSPPRVAALGDDNAGGTRTGDAATPPRTAWKSPPTRLDGEELRCSWPVPSRDGDLGRKKPPQFSQQPVLVSRRPSGASATPPPPSSSPETVLDGDPINISFDPHQKQMRGTETWEEKRRTSNPPAIAATSVDNNSSRAARPPLLPVPRQGRPPQNGRRGRGHHHFPHHNHHHSGNYSGGHQQQRPRHHWHASPFPPRQPTQTINDNFYHPMDQAMMGIPNLPQDWGFNTMPVLQWDPNPHLAPPYIAPPTENIFHRGYFSGPYFPEAFPHSAAPLSPIPPLPPGWNPPWFMGPPPGEAVLQNQPPNPPLPPPPHQAPVVNTHQDGADVDMRLRKQIEYYFSDENLMKDGYLKMCMDNQGWVSVHVIANFPRVQRLSRDVGFILGALQTSSIVEVSVDKMRRKDEWNRWIIRQHVLDGNREAPEG